MSLKEVLSSSTEARVRVFRESQRSLEPQTLPHLMREWRNEFLGCGSDVLDGNLVNYLPRQHYWTSQLHLDVWIWVWWPNDVQGAQNPYLCVLFIQEIQALCWRSWIAVRGEMRERGQIWNAWECMMRMLGGADGWRRKWDEKTVVEWREGKRERRKRECLTSAESRPHPTTAVQTHTQTQTQ